VFNFTCRFDVRALVRVYQRHLTLNVTLLLFRLLRYDNNFAKEQKEQKRNNNFAEEQNFWKFHLEKEAVGHAVR
jgi:hypothetical protein